MPNGTTTALIPAGSGALVANERVRLRATTWREQLGLVVALPFVFLLWAVMPIATLGIWASVALGAAVGFVPSAIVYRGRRVLRRARKRLGYPDVALPMFETLARRTLVGSAVRCDALAHAALIRLERGELEAALELIATPVRDAGSTVRARTPMIGYYGEAVRSVLAWLFPEGRMEPVASSVLRPTQDSNVQVGYEGVANMLAVLRILEAGHRSAPSAVRRAWTELDDERLSARHPTLCALVLGVVHRFDPGVQLDLERRLGRLPEEARTLVLRRFPELEPNTGATYRHPAAEESTSLQRIAPAGLQALHATRGLSKWFPFASAGGPWSAFFALWMVLAGLGAADGLLVVVGALFAVLGIGSMLHRRDRVRPLVAAGITGRARVRELSMMATRTGPRAWGAPPPHPFDRGELMLVVGLARAEASLRAGDRSAAREQIGWWLEGLDHSTLRQVDLHATASSALRVASMLGYAEPARHLNAWIRVGQSIRGRTRTGHGDAPRALWLARALHSSLRGDDAAAVRALDLAARNRPVVFDVFETELYGALTRRLAASGHIIPDPLRSLLGPNPAQWAEALWSDPGTVPPETPDAAPRALTATP